MHTNHRRSKPRYNKKYGGTPWPHIYSMKPMKRQKSRDRRAEERSLMERELWDELPEKYPKNIIWEYW